MALLMMVVMSVMLVACGGPDVQPAIDAFNEASTVYDRIANTINADSSSYPKELFDAMNEKADKLSEYKKTLENEDTFTEEQIADMIKIFEEIEAWAVETEGKLDELKIQYGDKQVVADALNKTSAVYDAMVDALSGDIDSLDDETITAINEVGTALLSIKELLESDKQITKDDEKTLLDQIADLDQWVADAEKALLQ